MFEIHNSIKDLHGAIPARKLLVERALQYLDGLSQESDGDPSLQRELAAAYDRVGDVQGGTASANLGDFSGALISYISRVHLGADYLGAAKEFRWTGDNHQAAQYANAAIDSFEPIARANPDNATYREYLAEIYDQSAPIFEDSGNLGRALKYSKDLVHIFEQLSSSEPSDQLARDNVGLSQLDLGELLLRERQEERSIPHFRMAVAVFESISHKNRYDVYGLNDADFRLGEAYILLADRDASPAKKEEHLLASRSWFEKSLNTSGSNIFSDSSFSTHSRDDIKQQLARCAAALKKLQRAD